jgi:hypothetical protein
MPAYSLPLELICDRWSCGKRATVKVFNTWNEHQGNYCVRHGAQRVKDMNDTYKKSEKEESA